MSTYILNGKRLSWDELPDENRQYLFERGLAPTSFEPNPMTAIPDDFPGREELIAAGFSTLEDVPTDADALEAINGIGPKTAVNILSALEA